MACAGTEPVFLQIALHGTAHHVETVVRQYRRATEAAELSREARQQAGRRLRYHWDEDGSLVLEARLPAEAGTLLLRALEAAEQDLPLPAVQFPRDTPVGIATGAQGSVSAETFQEGVPSYAARRADALAVLAESFLSHGA